MNFLYIIWQVGQEIRNTCISNLFTSPRQPKLDCLEDLSFARLVLHFAFENLLPCFALPLLSCSLPPITAVALLQGLCESAIFRHHTLHNQS